MKILLPAMIILLASCKPVVYLSTVGEVVYVGKDHITVVFPCENVRRPDCKGSADFSIKQFQNARIGQKITLKQ